MEEHERIRISGVINDVTFANPENGFTVLELESGDELITAVGVMPELKAGELLELSGYWDFHASFGRQFRVELCEHKMPASQAISSAISQQAESRASARSSRSK